MGSVMERKEDHLVKWEVVVQVQEKGSLGWDMWQGGI